MIPVAAAALLLCGCIKSPATSGIAIEAAGTSTGTDSSADSATASPGRIRIATYNIQYFSAQAALKGDRLTKLRKVMADMKPDVVAVEEVADREAMDLLFPKDKWQTVIDDDSDDSQDVAITVRRPFRIEGVAADLDADDKDFVAPEPELEAYFPHRRDALVVHVVPQRAKKVLTVIAVHEKARVGGRKLTDARREGASRILVERLKRNYAGQNIVLLGDFNDTPDDASIHILETGDVHSAGGMQQPAENFMVDLCAPLYAKNMVSEGASSYRLDSDDGLVNNVYPESRRRNDNGRLRDVDSGPLLIDQILVTKSIEPAVVPGSTTIFRKPIALQGNHDTKASDHLPVYTDIDLSKLPTAP